MFPVYIMDPSRQTQRRCGRPCFGEDQPYFWRFGNSCGRPPFRDANFEPNSDMHVPFENFLKKFAMEQDNSDKRDKSKDERTKDNIECETGEKDKTKSGEEEMSKDHNSKGAASFDSLINEVVRGVMQSFNKATEPTKWRQEVDCRGFKSKNIKVKIDARLLLIKANKKEESEFGVSTSSMRRNVPLPENIDHKKITCKLSPHGTLVIEAPIRDKTKDKRFKHDFLHDLMSTILPGLENTLTTHYGKCATNRRENENGKDDPTTENNKTGEEKAEDANKSNETTEDTKQEQTLPESETHPVADSEETSKMEFVRSDNLTEDQRNVQQNDKTPVNFRDDAESMESHQADNTSTSSEDSFVLLAELEKEEKSINPSSLEQDDNQENDDGSVSLTVQLEEEEKVEKEEEPKDLTFQDDKIPDTAEDKEASQDNAVHSGQGSMDISNPETPTSPQKEQTVGEEAFVYRIEMPSYDPESIQVNFDESKKVIVISASKERQSGTAKESISKTVAVSENVDVDNLHCFYRDGSLTVRAPIKQALRKIPIKV